MSKKMLINATHPEENRVAIVEDGILTELDIEIAGKEQTKGNIYKAAVVRVEPGLQAAFIDYGAERFGFLQMGEIHPSYFRTAENSENKRPRITDVLRRGQELLVQVVKEERGTKGAALTTFLSLPGRYMVLMPDSDTKGVSRKIEDESQRKKLKEAMASLDLPADMGYIVRTAGIGQKKEELKRDFDYLVRVYETIQEQARRMKAPTLIYKESNLAIRSIRDYFSSEMDEVLVDDPKVADEARDFFQQVMPEYARLVKLHQERRPIFSRYQIEEQIETITKNKVQLPSGGSIVIDVTEALVAVDVNSGKMAGEQGVEATAYKTNLEAAAEAARQLRLRDLGGLIVLDFIDMRERKHIREVEKCLKDSLKNDKARVTVGRISQFGLLEMSRQRIKAALAEGSFLPCPHCNGTGRVKSAEAQAVAFLRKVQSAIAKGQIGRVEGEVPLDVATYLLNYKREELLDMERRHQMVMIIKGRPDLVAGQANLSVFKREREELTSDLDRTVQLERTPPVERLSLASDLVLPTSPPPVALPLPAETEAPEEQTSGPVPETSSEEAAKKKRKRRRKRKKPEEGGAALATEQGAEAESAEGAEEEEEEEAVEPAETTSEAAATGETAPAAEERRRKRRRRRRKKPAAEGAELPAGEGEEEVIASPFSPHAETIPSLQELPAEEIEETVVLSPFSPHAETIPSLEERPVPAPDHEPVDTRAEKPSPTGDEAPQEGKPPRPRRRGRRKGASPAEEQVSHPPAEETPVPPLAAAEPVVSLAHADEAKAPAKKRRPSRRKTAVAGEDSKGTEAAAPAPVPSEEPEGKAPRRPRRRTKGTEAQPEPPAEGEAAQEKKPKRRPASRRKTPETPPEE